MKTWNAKKEDFERKWYIIDAQDKNLGRLSSKIATILIGKNKPTYTPNVDTGDFIVVINAKGVQMTGKKWLEKIYYRHSRFFGSTKEMSAEKMIDKDPCFMVQEAVGGMLPKSKLGRQMATKLKVYADGEHPHAAQKPQALSL